MLKYFARFILYVSGWTAKGSVPVEKKAIIVSVPHTSSWDFIWGKLSFMSVGFKTMIMMKKEYFFFPLGIILRGLGVIPVDRGNRGSGMTQKMVDEFSKRESMYLTITPEGSRKLRKRWKKGFLIIAKEANIPIYLGRIDYVGKFCTWGERFYPTGDIDADLKYIMSTYKDANPKYPELFSTGD